MSQLATNWEVYFKWYPDKVIGLYCGRCGGALTDAPATRWEFKITPGKLSSMISIHVKNCRGPVGRT